MKKKKIKIKTLVKKNGHRLYDIFKLLQKQLKRNLVLFTFLMIFTYKNNLKIKCIYITYYRLLN